MPAQAWHPRQMLLATLMALLSFPQAVEGLSGGPMTRSAPKPRLAFISGAEAELSIAGLKDCLAGLKDFAIGGVSGAIAQTIVFPIDLAKTRIQDQVAVPGAAARYSGVFQTIFKVAKDEGLPKLWSGVTPVLIGCFPECALEIGGNSLARVKVAEHLNMHVDQLPGWAEFASGGVAGFCQVIATCPMERLKILQQVGGKTAGSVSQIVSQIGIAGLYQGVEACYARDIVFAGLYFGIYYETRKALQQRKQNAAMKRNGQTAELGPLDDLIAGMAAGVPAALITCPLDVIKTRMQACGLDANGCRVAVGSFSTTAAELWAEGGAAAMFKGVGGRVGRVAPQMAICLVLYQALTKFLEPPQPVNKRPV